MRTPTYWPTGLQMTSVQTHSVSDAVVAKKLAGRHILFACQGEALEVWEIPYGVLWARMNLPESFREVWGGEWSESADFRLPQTNMGQTPNQNIEQIDML